MWSRFDSSGARVNTNKLIDRAIIALEVLGGIVVLGVVAFLVIVYIS